MKSQAPSLNDWKKLYEATAAFKALEAWNWMSDADLFGVRNPQNGEIGYCCVMGQLGEVFGMAVYQGSEGLDGYLRMQSGELAPDDLHVGYIQKCLLASFEDRASLEKEDLQTIKKLGLKFRGRNAWPQFRSYLPGYVPWFLTKDEARFLTIVMEQAIDVALRFKEDRDILEAPTEDSVMVRSLESRDREKHWQDEWVKLPSEREADADIESPDEFRLRRIQKNVTEKRGIWEIGYFVLPAPVDEGERPYFPYATVVADASSGMLIQTWLASPEQFYAEFPKGLLSLVEETGVLPQGILVDEYNTFRMIEPIASKLGLDLEVIDELETIEEFKEGLYSYLVEGG
jgi:hypothetical protein